MNIELLKKELLEKIKEQDNIQVLSSILDYADYIEDKYSFEEKEDTLSEDDLKSIEEGKQDYKDGKCISLKDYMKEDVKREKVEA